MIVFHFSAKTAQYQNDFPYVFSPAQALCGFAKNAYANSFEIISYNYVS